MAKISNEADERDEVIMSVMRMTMKLIETIPVKDDREEKPWLVVIIENVGHVVRD